MSSCPSELSAVGQICVFGIILSSNIEFFTLRPTLRISRKKERERPTMRISREGERDSGLC
jgi:hypothetical protein